MGNAIDCNTCNNLGWKREAGCPSCKRRDFRPQHDYEWERDMRQHHVNAEVDKRKQ